jgi:hypothetical protein
MNFYTRFLRSRTKIGRPVLVRPEVELLEARNLLSAPPTNVLVNNPAEDTTNRDTQSETAIVLGANSNIIVAFNDDGGAPPPHVWQEGGWSMSTNGGTSFTDEGTFPPAPSPYVAAVDPGLARSSKTGTIFLSAAAGSLAILNDSARVNIFRSTDNGATFFTSVSGTPGFVDGVDRADKPWMAVDNYPGPGYGNVYLVWTDFTFKNNGSLSEEGIFFTRSTDDGVTWGPSGGVPIAVKPGSNPTQDAWVTVGPDHTVYLFWWDGNNPSENIMMSKSTDQGQTFSNPVIVARLNTRASLGDLGLTNSAGQTFHTSVIPEAAVNPVTGDIYLVYADAPKNSIKDKADILFTQSTDGGATWSAPLRVNDDNTTNDQWNPAIALTPDGSHVGIFWYDRRLDPANNLIDRFGVIGTVSGHSVSFAPNFRITDVSFPPAFGQDPFWVGVGAAGYMGDYDMATADNHYFYSTWGDNRLGDAFFANQPDVRFAKIPVGGESDPSLVLSGARTVAGSSPVGFPSDGSVSDPARLLVGAINSMAGTTPARLGPAPLDRSGNPNIRPAQVLSPLAPIDMSASQGAGSTISRITPATAMKALDLVLAEDGDASLADVLALGVIGS